LAATAVSLVAANLSVIDPSGAKYGRCQDSNFAATPIPAIAGRTIS